MAEIIVNRKPVPFPKDSPNIGGVLKHPSLIVLHSTGGAFGGAISWMLNPQAKVSAHFCVSRMGEIRQLVPLGRIAYHAGVSSFEGKNGCNSFSIGVEMEHFDGRQDWPDAQIEAVAALCKALQRRFGISRIVGHRDVAPGRKIDPLNFPWDSFREALANQPAEE